ATSVNYQATTEIYTLSLHDALPICKRSGVEVITPLDLRRSSVEKTAQRIRSFVAKFPHAYVTVDIDALDPAYAPGVGNPEPDGRSEEHTSELQSRSDLVCRLLLEKK